MQKKEAVYSLGNLLILIGIVVVASSLFWLHLSGLARTGVNMLGAILVFAGTGLPLILKELDRDVILRSIGLRSFTSSFILSILLTVQMLSRGWASTVPVLASLALALSGIISYMLSGQGGKIMLPHIREILLFISVIIIFATPLIQLSLPWMGVGADVARMISISLLIAFAVVLYVSLKVLSERKGGSTSVSKENR
ncbi:MAG: hypothetical protein ACUVQ0_06095 [Thermoproteota archaeon]